VFSVVIPLYNKELYIARTIQSVLDQTYKEFEIIIVDDGSTDRSVAEVKKIDDERIRIVGQKNAGVSAARNRGIKEARYDLIAFLDADDEWLSSHLQELIQLKNDFPECQVFATNYKIIDTSNSERLPVNTSVLDINGKTGVIKNYFKAGVKTAPPLWTSAIAMNKEAIKNVGGFPLNVTSGEDLLTWARLACRYKIAYSKRVTAIYHFYTISEWLMNARKQDKIDTVGMSLAALLKVCQEQRSGLEKYIALWHRMRLHNFMKRGDKLNAGRELYKILKYSKTDYKSYVLYLLTLIPEKLRKYILHKRAVKLEKVS